MINIYGKGGHARVVKYALDTHPQKSKDSLYV